MIRSVRYLTLDPRQKDRLKLLSCIQSNDIGHYCLISTVANRIYFITLIKLLLLELNVYTSFFSFWYHVIQMWLFKRKAVAY